MSTELWITIVFNLLTIAATATAAWFALKKQASNAEQKATEVEAETCELRETVDDLRVRVARQEVLQEQHGRELQQGMARIEAAVVALHARLDRALSRGGQS